MMAVMRAVLAALTIAALAVPLSASAAQVPAPRPVHGSWSLGFTPESVRPVGDAISRDGGLECGGAERCGSSYQFEPGDLGSGKTIAPLVTFDAKGCTSLPCEIETGRERGNSFTGTVTYDGTTYRGSGKWFYASAFQCEQYLPDGTDTLTFTVGGTADDPTLTGTMTALLAYVGPTAENGDCTDVTGYEVYSGSVTGTPVGGNSGFLGGTPGTAPGAVPGTGVSTVAPEARADDIAARTHDRPILSTRVATAKQLPWSPGRVLTSAVLALVLVLLMPFPAALFNSTLEANYAEVSGWFSFLRRGDRDPAKSVVRGWRGFALLVGAIAVLNAFLDPGLGFDRASLVLVAGLALSVAAVSLLSSLPSRLYHRRRFGDRAAVALFPLGLAVAAVCVVISRVTSFEPGYLYGVVAGFAFARDLNRGERGRITVATSGLLLVTAAAAFAVRIPVHDAVLDGGGVPIQLLDTVLAAVFAAGIEANVLGLLPVRFLPGEELFAWSKAAWAAIFGVNLFAFLHALSAAGGGATTGASVTVAAALFLSFGAVSVAFWAWFRFRRTDPTPTSV